MSKKLFDETKQIKDFVTLLNRATSLKRCDISDQWYKENTSREVEFKVKDVMVSSDGMVKKMI